MSRKRQSTPFGFQVRGSRILIVTFHSNEQPIDHLVTLSLGSSGPVNVDSEVIGMNCHSLALIDNLLVAFDRSSFG